MHNMLTFMISWSTEHPKIWLSVPIVREKIVKYQQFHVNDDFRKNMGDHLPFAQFDGAAEMYVEKLEDLATVFQNEEYLKVVVPDEEKFLKRDEAVMLIGQELPKWVEGKAL
jgi:hypothetical protein